MTTKKVLVLAAVAAMVAGSAVYAQDSSLFFDVRDNSSANQLINTPTYPYTVGGANGGMAGDGQTLFISPVRSDNWQAGAGWPNNDADSNSATGTLWLYMDVKTDDSGAAGVVSSVGLDFNVTAPPTPKNVLGSLAFAWDSALFAGAGTKAGKANGTGGVTGWTGAKAVFVPVGGTPPAFDTTGGLLPAANTHQKLGALTVTGGTRSCVYGSGFEAASTYTIKLTVNGLLITRAFPSGTGDAVETVAFGYSAGLPETPYVNGSTSGGTSALADGTIIVNIKGDNTNDGRVQTVDQAGFNAAKIAGIGGAPQRQVYINDFTGDRRVQTVDQAGFNAAKTHSATCP